PGPAGAATGRAPPPREAAGLCRRDRERLPDLLPRRPDPGAGAPDARVDRAVRARGDPAAADRRPHAEEARRWVCRRRPAVWLGGRARGAGEGPGGAERDPADA